MILQAVKLSGMSVSCSAIATGGIRRRQHLISVLSAKRLVPE